MKLWQKFLLALGSIPAALGAVDYDLQLTQSGLNLAADGLEVVSFARIIAVEPPWGHKYFFNAYTVPGPCRNPQWPGYPPLGPRLRCNGPYGP